MADAATTDLLKKILEEKVRPSLMAHGGDLEFVAVTDDNRLVVRLHGACSQCPASQMTLEETVAVAVREVWPDLEGIEVETAMDADIIAKAKEILSRHR